MNAETARILAGYALMIGAATIIILSIRDFHRPFRIDEIRYAVMRERYWLALIVYASIGLFFYIIVVYTVRIPLIFAIVDFEKVGESDVVLSRRVTLLLSVVASILVLLVAANTPFVRIPVDWIRRVVQRLLARYPASADIMTALIARSRFSFVERGDEELRRELANYGIPDALIVTALKADRKVLLPAAASLLREVCSLYAGVTALGHERRFRRFIAARREVIDGLEREYRHLLRCAAQSIMLVDDLGASDDTSSELVRGMSDFIAEQAQPVRAGYQRLVAQAAVSRLSESAGRKMLLAGFGYDVDLPRSLPIVPLVIVFLLDWIIAVTPALMGQRYPHVRLDPFSALIIGFIAASAFATAIGLGVYPKTITSFARPSLFSLPWKSYFVFGILAYFVGAGAFVVALNSILSIGTLATNEISQNLLAGHPTLVSMLFGMAFPVTTIVLSVLLDRRLQAHSINFRRRRAHDGMFLAGAIAVTWVAINAGWVLLEKYYGLPPVEFELSRHAVFIVLFAAFGFVIGFVIPSTVEAYIKANEILFAPGKPSPLPPPRALPQPGPAE
jgi:hypothetical protein